MIHGFCLFFQCPIMHKICYVWMVSGCVWMVSGGVLMVSGGVWMVSGAVWVVYRGVWGYINTKSILKRLYRSNIAFSSNALMPSKA